MVRVFSLLVCIFLLSLILEWLFTLTWLGGKLISFIGVFLSWVIIMLLQRWMFRERRSVRISLMGFEFQWSVLDWFGTNSHKMIGQLYFYLVCLVVKLVLGWGDLFVWVWIGPETLGLREILTMTFLMLWWQIML